jgi:hypothetical protein
MKWAPSGAGFAGRFQMFIPCAQDAGMIESEDVFFAFERGGAAHRPMSTDHRATPLVVIVPFHAPVR